MPDAGRGDPLAPLDASQVVIPCADLDAAIAFYTGQLGFRLDMLMPADAPRVAVVSGAGIALRLEASVGSGPTSPPFKLRLPASRAPNPGNASQLLAPDGTVIEFAEHGTPVPQSPASEAFVLGRASDAAEVVGRAGMRYRDLIPGRLGGRFIASHIHIPEGGPVPDYVHYHRVGFQLICCRRGWVRVVYEDQGEPFTMQAGDCVLQPPTIRHRVLEASTGLEVIEISCPAEHETLRDHDLELPSAQLRPDRRFQGQRFVRHVAAVADWQASGDGGFESCDTGIGDATGGLADVRVLRAAGEPAGQASARTIAQLDTGRLLFVCVLEGRCRLDVSGSGTHALAPVDACMIPAGSDYTIEAAAGTLLLEVAMPAR